MEVSSYLELFTTLIGWMMYNRIWDMFVMLGIFMIPFISFIVTNTHKATQEGNATASIKMSEMDIYIALFIMFFSVTPFVPLDVMNLKFIDRSGAPSTAMNVISPPANTPYTLSNAMTNPASNRMPTAITESFASNPNATDTSIIKMPLYWTFTSLITSGIVAVMESIIPTKENFAMVAKAFSQLKIKEPDLHKEMQQFMVECHIPAVNKITQFPAIKTTSSYISALTTFGNDTQWAGSRLLLNTNGLYKVCPNPVQCGKKQIGVTKNNLFNFAPYNGFPTCAAWWGEKPFLTDADLASPSQAVKASLRYRLLKQGEKQGFFKDKTWTAVNWFRSRQAVTEVKIKYEDAIYKKLLETVEANNLVSEKYGKADHNGSNIANTIMHGVKTVFGSEELKDKSDVEAVKRIFLYEFMQIMQPILLMLFYLFLPFVQVFSRFSIAGIVGATFFFFSLKLLPFIWDFSSWLDNTLVFVMFSDAGSYSDTALGLIPYIDAGAGDSQRVLLDMVTSSLYWVMPLTWLSLMGVAGVKSARFVAHLESVQKGDVGSNSGMGRDTMRKSAIKSSGKAIGKMLTRRTGRT